MHWRQQRCRGRLLRSGRRHAWLMTRGQDRSPLCQLIFSQLDCKPLLVGELVELALGDGLLLLDHGRLGAPLSLAIPWRQAGCPVVIGDTVAAGLVAAKVLDVT
jgi:hypothetical protein